MRKTTVLFMTVAALLALATPALSHDQDRTAPTDEPVASIVLTSAGTAVAPSPVPMALGSPELLSAQPAATFESEIIRPVTGIANGTVAVLKPSEVPDIPGWRASPHAGSTSYT